MQHVTHALRISEPMIQMGVTGENTIHSLYNTMYNIKQALEGIEEGYPMKDRELMTYINKRNRTLPFVVFI